MHTSSSVGFVAATITTWLVALTSTSHAEAPAADAANEAPAPKTFVRVGMDLAAVGEGAAIGPRVTWSPSRGALYAEVGGFVAGSTWDGVMFGAVVGGGLRGCSEQHCLSLGVLGTVGVQPGQAEARDGHPNGRWYVAEAELAARFRVDDRLWLGVSAAGGPIGEPRFYESGYYEDDLEMQARAMLSLEVVTARESAPANFLSGERVRPGRGASPWIATASLGLHGAVAGLRVAADRTVRGPLTLGGAVWGGPRPSDLDMEYLRSVRGVGAGVSAGVRSQRERTVASAEVVVGTEYVEYDGVVEEPFRRQLGVHAEVAGRLLTAAGPLLVGVELRARLPGAIIELEAERGTELGDDALLGGGLVLGGRW